jgi:hypothetical protein
MIFIWFALKILPSMIFMDAVKIFKKNDNLIMIIYIVFSIVYMIYLDFEFLGEHIFEGVLFSVYLFFSFSRTESSPKKLIENRPYFYLTLFMIISLLGLTLYLILT